MIKRVFIALSLFSMVNLAALVLGGVALWQKGWLQQDRVRQAVSILRGESAESTPTSESAPVAAEVVKAEEQPGTIQQTGELIRESREADEAMRIEFARREREIQDGFRLWEARQLALLREKEALEEAKRRFAEQREQLARSSGNDGIQKEIDTLSGIPARAAKDLLITKGDAEAAAILKAMDQRKLNKIVKECKTEDERRWIGRILERFQGGSTAKAENLDAG